MFSMFSKKNKLSSALASAGIFGASQLSLDSLGLSKEELEYLEAQWATDNFSHSEKHKPLVFKKVQNSSGNYVTRIFVTYKGKKWPLSLKERGKRLAEMNAPINQQRDDRCDEKGPSKLTPIVMVAPATQYPRLMENIPKPTIQTNLTPPMDIPLMSPPPVAESNRINPFLMPEESKSITICFQSI